MIQKWRARAPDRGVDLAVSAPLRPLECVAQKRREAELPMHELAVWKAGKQRQYDAQMDDQQPTHRRRLAQSQQEQSCKAGQQQQHDETLAEIARVKIVKCRVTPSPQPEQAGRAGQ